MVAALVLFMPKTRGEPLEAIDEIFSKPMLRSWGNVKKLVSSATASLGNERASSDGGTGVAGEVDGGAPGQSEIEMQVISRETQMKVDTPMRPTVLVS